MPLQDPFDRLKSTVLAKFDRSPKGSIDPPALPLLELVNGHPDWISTSSCSGRIAVYAPGGASGGAASGTTGGDAEATEMGPPVADNGMKEVNGKGAGSWLFVSHGPLAASQLASPLDTLFGSAAPEPPGSALSSAAPPLQGLVHLKYEGPVFHLATRTVASALPVLHAAIAAGFRNSGLVVGAGRPTGRVTLAVRLAPGGLDVPIAFRPRGRDRFVLLVDPGYLGAMLQQADRLMRLNQERLDRLHRELEGALKPGGELRGAPVEWEDKEARRQRLRREGLATQTSKRPSAPGPSVASPDEDLANLGWIR